MSELDGRVAIVSGAAMGIGKASAAALGRSGAKVMIADFDREAGERSAAELRAGGAEVLFHPCDVRSFDEVSAAVDHTVSHWGRIDILVNNAARALGGVVDEIDEASWNEVISNNLTSVWRFMRCVVPHMRKAGKGAIVNLSSVQSLKGFHGWPAYAAAKGGINALTQQTALELASAGIRVNAVAPGTIMTPLNERVFREATDPKELIERWNAAHPLGRFGEAEEVAEAVLFLASDRSSFITGDILRVDGGLVIKGD